MQSVRSRKRGLEEEPQTCGTRPFDSNTTTGLERVSHKEIIMETMDGFYPEGLDKESCDDTEFYVCLVVEIGGKP